MVIAPFFVTWHSLQGCKSRAVMKHTIGGQRNDEGLPSFEGKRSRPGPIRGDAAAGSVSIYVFLNFF